MLAALPADVRVILVDFHAEATSDKQLMGRHLDGRVSAVLGTHTHVATADEQILPGGTAFQCDVGMTGPHESILGRRIDRVMETTRTFRPTHYEVATGDVRLNGAIVDVDPQTGRATAIRRISRRSGRGQAARRGQRDGGRGRTQERKTSQARVTRTASLTLRLVQQCCWSAVVLPDSSIHLPAPPLPKSLLRALGVPAILQPLFTRFPRWHDGSFLCSAPNCLGPVLAIAVLPLFGCQTSSRDRLYLFKGTTSIPTSPN